jgi:hypothetical protein
MTSWAMTTVGFAAIQKLLLYFDGFLPMSVGDLHDMRLKPRKMRQRLIELEQRADVMYLVRHACQFFADLKYIVIDGLRC